MPEQPAQQGLPEREQAEQQHLYSLVVIGASAGGIEALSSVLGALAPDFPAPIVVAQHLDPNRPSHLDVILARRTRLITRTVSEVEPLAAGTVYLVPADRDVEISDHEVRLRPATSQSKPSINRLFSSAARAYGEHLIAVILTGTGSDGAEGAREAKVSGGMVVIEDPASAAFPGMPRSLAPTTVDIVAPLDEIGPLLHDLLAGTYTPRPLDPDHAQLVNHSDAAHDDLVAPLLAHLRERSGIDFTSYRRPTILRRLQRCMAATKMTRLDDYLRYLARQPDEYQRLVSSFLIKVTEFFRDPDLFSALREQVLPVLIAQARQRQNQLRLWSAGCATGEEAYSLAILVAEALGPELGQFTVRLFATDLDERAVAYARQGVYPATALAGVSDVLRERYFTRLDGTYEVKRPIRSLVIFGEHDLAQRPPFPHIDLVLCRNVLIYFTPELQQRALRVFAFALRPGGYLALGKAESAAARDAYFAPIHPPLKLYRRGDASAPPLLPSAGSIGERLVPLQPDPRQTPPVGTMLEPEPSRRAPVPAAPPPTERERTAEQELEHAIFDLPVGVVMVNRQYHIQAINSAALRLLDIYRPAVGGDLVHLSERVPSPALRRIIDTVFRAESSAGSLETDARPEAPPAASEVVTLETGLGERRELQIAAYLRRSGTANAGGERTERAERIGTALLLITDVTAVVEERRAAEQASTRDLREPDKALQRRDDEVARLRAEVERVTAINRQLVTANQELGVFNLELHQTSDELMLAQEQEQATAEEIRTLNEELQASNEELETMNEEMEATVEELRAANDDLAVRTQEAQDLAASLAREKQASDSERARLEAILLGLGDAVLVVDPAGTPLLTNAAYTRMFGDTTTPFAAKDTDGHPLAPEATPQQRVARGETFIMEFTLDGQDGVRRYFEASGQPIRSAGEALGGVISVRDITERSLYHLENEFVALASHELRTPLTSMQAYLQLLGRLFADQPKDAPARRYTALVQHQVRRLTRLVQDLLDIRRLQNGKFNLEVERMPLDQMVAGTVEVAQAMTTGQTIHLDHPGAPLFVNGDAMRLEQVLLNLLTNAITYASHSERIDVRLRRVGSEAELRVRDFGSGIPASDLPHIFSRFYQVERTDVDRPSRHGLGLGLYIVHELVVAHGGRIEVASAQGPGDGHGTTFTIHLPLAPNGADEQPRKERRRTE